MKSKYRVDVDYSIEGFEFDPEEITLITGIEPSKVTRAGESVSWESKIRTGSVPKVKFNLWELKSDLDSLTEVNEQVSGLIQQLKPSWSEFVKLGDRYGGMFTCVIWDYSDTRPAIYFDQTTVKAIAELNAEIQVSVYALEEE
jgi:Domain of unknown function (DUF4279)